MHDRRLLYRPAGAPDKMIWLTRPRQPRSAAQPILRLLPLEQEGLHGLIYASVVSVRSVPIAVVLDQDPDAS